MESVGSRRERGMEKVENGVEEQGREWDKKYEEKDKEEERETMGGGKVREKVVEEKEEEEAIKHYELILFVYNPRTLLAQCTACLSLCCLSTSGTSHWHPRWPQRKCLAHSIMRLHSEGLFCEKEGGEKLLNRVV